MLCSRAKRSFRTGFIPKGLHYLKERCFPNFRGALRALDSALGSEGATWFTAGAYFNLPCPLWDSPEVGSGYLSCLHVPWLDAEVENRKSSRNLSAELARTEPCAKKAHQDITALRPQKSLFL